jgi:hypothetical protein
MVSSGNIDKIESGGQTSSQAKAVCFDSSNWNRVIGISREQEIGIKKQLFEVTGEGYFHEDISRLLV